jgi:hypothetical protein
MTQNVDKDLIPEGVININSPAAKHLYFTSDRFNPHSYLWRTGNTITISFIMSKQKGNFRRLMNRIIEMGFDFEIPTPSGRMVEIAKKQDWVFRKKDCEAFGCVDIITSP